jgi:hypothetical protein
MSTTFTSVTLAGFKTAQGITTVNVKQSRKSGKLYCSSEKGFIGMLAPDYKGKELHVLSMTDNDTGEGWLFVCPLEETPTIDTL